MITDPLQLFAILVGVILIAIVLDQKYTIAQRISPVIMILGMGGLLSNTGVIAEHSPLYPGLRSFTVPFAVCLILFTVKLSDVIRVGPALLVAFVLACLGSIVGTVMAGLLLDPYLTDIMGSEGWKLAGPFAGTYIGGSLNFSSLWDGLEIGNQDLFAAANAVDNVFLLPLFVIWILVPDLLRRFYPVAAMWKRDESRRDVPREEEAEPPFRIRDITALVLAALLVMVFSALLKANLGFMQEYKIPGIILVTAFALILGQVPLIHRLKGARQLSTLAFFVFFAAVGAEINILRAIELSPILFLYVTVILIVHMVIVYGLGRVLRIDIRILTIASIATKAGPPSVPAITNLKGWNDLLLPGVALALLGYAVGNFLGFATARCLQALL